jgi:CheY-like chemotaxis protein
MTPETLLVVEDNAIQREGMAVVLRQEGYSVVTMEDGQLALDYLLALDHLRSSPLPSLILLEMLFPPGCCDGWGVLEVRKQYPSLAAIPVLITTSIGSATDEWPASLGAAGCLKKPVEVRDLLEAVHRLAVHQPVEKAPATPGEQAPAILMCPTCKQPTDHCNRGKDRDHKGEFLRMECARCATQTFVYLGQPLPGEGEQHHRRSRTA